MLILTQGARRRSRGEKSKGKAAVRQSPYRTEGGRAARETERVDPNGSEFFTLQSRYRSEGGRAARESGKDLGPF